MDLPDHSFKVKEALFANLLYLRHQGPEVKPVKEKLCELYIGKTF